MITVRFSAGDWESGGQSITVEKDFQHPLGRTFASTSLLVPLLDDWEVINLEVWVDGIKDDQLSARRVRFNADRNTTGLSALMISLSDIRKDQIALNSLAQGRMEINVVRPSSRLTRFGFSAADLFHHWQEYSGVDLVVLQRDDFQQFPKRYPEATAALLRWVRAGGILLIHDAGDRWQHLPSVEQSLGLAPTTTEVPSDAERHNDEADTPTSRGWRVIEMPEHDKDSTTTNEAFEARDYDGGLMDYSQGPTGYEIVPPDLRQPDESPKASQVKMVEIPVVKRPFGFGTVYVFRDRLHQGNMQQSDELDDFWQKELQPSLHWDIRHGFVPDAPCKEFNNWLIPGTGVAPIVEFLLLISLFVLTIGPLNYWLFKKWKRLPWILVTVPVASFAATLLLFAYVLVSDGIGVRLRARSCTWIDQPNGEAACWARSTYYAGISPAEGLQFSPETTVYPLVPSWAGGDRLPWRYHKPQRELIWSDRQELVNGWLPSRMPVQLVTIAARKTQNRLEFQRADDQLQVTNLLGTRVEMLAVQDPAGQYFWGEQIGPDDTITLEKIGSNDFAARFREIYLDNLPEYPPGANTSGTNFTGPQLAQNKAEAFLTSMIDSPSSSVGKSPGCGTYFAVTSTGPEYEPGIERATEIASFHVVRGVWRP